MQLAPDAPISQTVRCPSCFAEIAPALLTCPACHSFVHSEKLKKLAEDAAVAEKNQQLAIALQTWRSALELLPESTNQFSVIQKKIADLSARVDAKSASPDNSHWGRKLAGLGAIGLLLWKFKFVLVFLLTKGKLLLLGLTKGGTVLTMLLSFGVYWAAWGWPFALGLVLSIYVHEMGHVAALRRFGIAASAPMFIPGLGALVRMKQYPASAKEDARVGLAGPVWGMFAALAVYAFSFIHPWEGWKAIARVGAWINLFNLLPLLPFDGGRGFHVLKRLQKIAIAACMAVMFLLTREGLLILLAIVAAGNIFLKKDDPAQETDWQAFAEYMALLIVLSLMCTIPVSV